MPRIRALREPPIAEAIIDIRIITRPGFQAEKFSELTEQLKERFPKRDERRGARFKIQMGPSGPIPPEHEDLGFQGYFFRNEDEKLIAQFRIDGFTLNRLKPYTSWEEIFPLAMDLWNLYQSVALPVRVTRVALRYINQLPLLPNANTIDRYLRTPPLVPEELPQHLMAFFSRITIQEPHTNNTAHIAQALEADTASQQGKLLLDIDTFTTKDLASDVPTISAAFQQLRDFKNLIFFSYLTEEILEHFE